MQLQRGPKIQLANRTDRQLLSQCDQTIERQRAEIDQLACRLAEHEHAERKCGAVPRIY